MSDRPNKRLVILSSLVILIGVLGGFISVLVFFGLIYVYGLWTFVILAVAVFSVFIVSSAYVAFRKRQWATLAIIFSIVGVLILTSSTLAALPYSTGWTYQTQYSYKVLNETASIKPNETMSYEHNFYNGFTLNSTLIQVRISSSSNNLSMQLYAANEYEWRTMAKPEPVLNITRSYGQLGFDWRSYYWVPSGENFGLYENGPYNIGNASSTNFLAVVLTNLDNSEAMVYLQLDMFYRGETQRVTTNYRPLIDTSLSFAGVGLIGMAVIIEAYPSLRKKTQKIG
jgi:hypothetical protein